MGTIDANHRYAAHWEQLGINAMKDQKYQKAADDFNKAAGALDRAGDRENASRDYERAADALDDKGDLKGAAHYLEKAGADITYDLSVKNDLRRDVRAEMDYSKAGEDRMNAGKAAGKNHKEAAKQYEQAKEDFTKAADADARIGVSDDTKKYSAKAALASEKAAAEAGEDHMDAGKAAGRNHKEAAKQYGEAEVDFIKAADVATRLGNIDDAKKYSAKADQAGEAAAKQEKLVKPEDTLPAHKNPKNRL
jgi:tetratricopeptide (TPR) repeat protein